MSDLRRFDRREFLGAPAAAAGTGGLVEISGRRRLQRLNSLPGSFWRSPLRRLILSDIAVRRVSDAPRRLGEAPHGETRGEAQPHGGARRTRLKSFRLRDGI
jgi:hypothetical protein